MTFHKKKILGTATLIFSIVFFAMGMYFPLLSTHKQIIFKFNYTEISVFQSITMFWEDKEYFLAAIILLFTFIIPVIKYIELIFRTISNKESTKTIQNLDKWNMLDVFLVALLLLNFKMNSNIIVMQLKIGTTFIALSVIFRILTISLMKNTNK
jgi:paraquat-inducible protein A